MRRRSACRALLGLLAAVVCGCGSGAADRPTPLPPNRFPKGPAKGKPKEGQPGQGGERR